MLCIALRCLAYVDRNMQHFGLSSNPYVEQNTRTAVEITIIQRMSERASETLGGASLKFIIFFFLSLASGWFLDWLGWTASSFPTIPLTVQQ